MALNCPKLIVPLLAASALLGLGACSPLQHGTDSVTGPGRSGVHPQMIAGCPTLEANTVANPLVFNTEVAMVPQFRTGRLRIESIGDVATTSILSMGPCAATDIPTINFISGHANVFVSNSTQSITTTGTRLTFGALLFNPIIPGSVNANDAQGNSFQVIWPALAGVGTGSPRIRVQLAQWDQSLVNPSSKLDVSWDLVVSQNGVQTFIRGSASGLTMDGLGVFPGGAAILPCPASIAGTSGTVATAFADLVQFRSNRMRFEIWGDVASGTIAATGGCATAIPASINFLSGSGNVFRSGTTTSVTRSGQPLSFGALIVPLTLEPGVVLTTNATGDLLEIIWPALAGVGVGPPRLRLQLATWNAWVLTGRKVDVAMTFNATGPDGSTATYTARADGITVPQMK